jgi:hypothetical protein
MIRGVLIIREEGAMSTNTDMLSVTCNDNGGAEVILIRPELLNRFDNQLDRDLAAAFERLGGDQTVRDCSRLDRQGVFGRWGLRLPYEGRSRLLAEHFWSLDRLTKLTTASPP